MGSYIVRSSRVRGDIHIPASKSHTLRALLFGALGCGKSVIYNYLPSTDVSSMCRALQLFGAKVQVLPESISIEGVDGKIGCAEDVIDAGNSGIVLRFCAALAALSEYPIVITGDHSIRHQRPMQPLLEGLSQLGVKAISTKQDGYAPVIIQGPIHFGKAVIHGEDSQPVSALLILAAFARQEIEIDVINAGEKPWVALTLDWFRRLNIDYDEENFEKYRLKGDAHYAGFEYTVPGDFSSAAFPIAAALVSNSEIIVHNIDMNDPQGDKALIRVFTDMGANIEIDHEKKRLHVKKCTGLLGISVDINDFVDAITILTVVACFAKGETLIKNAHIARHKECDRIHAIATELKKMGADINETEDGLKIIGKKLDGVSGLYSYNDHRMVMSLTVAAMGASGESSITPVECVAKTFPKFLESFTSIGADIQEVV